MIEKHYTFCCLNQGNLNILQCWDFLNSNSISPLWSGIFSFHEGSILIPLFFLSWYLWTIFSIINWFSLATLVIFIVDLRYIFHYNTEMTMCDGYSRWGLHDDLTHILWTQGIPQIFIKGHLHFNQQSWSMTVHTLLNLGTKVSIITLIAVLARLVTIFCVDYVHTKIEFYCPYAHLWVCWTSWMLNCIISSFEWCVAILYIMQ